jgi:hypothetical protein
MLTFTLVSAGGLSTMGKGKSAITGRRRDQGNTDWTMIGGVAAVVGVVIALAAFWFQVHSDSSAGGAAAPTQAPTVDQPRASVPVKPPAESDSTETEEAEDPAPAAPTSGWASAMNVIGDGGQYDEETVVVDGDRYPESVAFTQWSMYDGGTAEFTLARNCTKLRMTIGFEDSAADNATADLYAKADGKRVWSRSMKYGDQPKKVTLNVSGVLRVVVGGTYDLGGQGAGGPTIASPEIFCDPIAEPSDS